MGFSSAAYTSPARTGPPIVLGMVDIYIIMFITMKLKLRAVGTSTGLVLPKEMLTRMKVRKDDQIFVVETPDGYLLTPYDPEVDRQLEKGRKVMARYRETFRALAK